MTGRTALRRSRFNVQNAKTEQWCPGSQESTRGADSISRDGRVAHIGFEGRGAICGGSEIGRVGRGSHNSQGDIECRLSLVRERFNRLLSGTRRLASRGVQHFPCSAADDLPHPFRGVIVRKKRTCAGSGSGRRSIRVSGVELVPRAEIVISLNVNAWISANLRLKKARSSAGMDCKRSSSLLQEIEGVKNCTASEEICQVIRTVHPTKQVRIWLTLKGYYKQLFTFFPAPAFGLTKSVDEHASIQNNHVRHR